MKWMLVVVVFGVSPVKTGLLYDDLDSCWEAREPIAEEYADVVNDRLRWAHKTLSGEEQTRTLEFLTKSLAPPAITCIPHAESWRSE